VNLRTKLVFRGFLELSSDEQKEFASLLYRFLWDKEETPLPPEEFSEIRAIALGPVRQAGVCPCCGRTL
jgi:hypothetical protein